MPFERLKIIPESGAEIKARFNPAKYRLEKAVKLAEQGIPGLDWPIVQFVRGETEKISFELFFDTTEDGIVETPTDVRTLTKKVHALLRVNGERHAPLRCKLKWGTGGELASYGTTCSPWCVLESVSEEFLLFSPTGVPLRAKQAVVFKVAWTVTQQLQETPRHTATRTSVSRLAPGQTLSHLATEKYGDPGAWRLIAEANAIDDPLDVVAGTDLRMPRADAGAG